MGMKDSLRYAVQKNERKEKKTQKILLKVLENGR